MRSFSVLVGLVLVSQGLCSVPNNLLQNPDFEGDFTGNWYCNECTLKKSTNAYQGQYAGEVSARSRRISCLRQDVAVSGGKLLYFKIRVKLLNCFDNAQGHKLETYVIIKTAGGQDTVRFGKMLFVFPSTGYALVGGDFETPSDTVSITLMVLNDMAALNFVADEASLVEIYRDPNWRQSANERIEQHRKGTIRIAYSIAPEYDLSKVEISVQQKRHDFGFGVAVPAYRMYPTDSYNKGLQEWVRGLFTWATITNAMKWRFLESTEGKPYFDVVDQCIASLKSMNISIRGHCLAWAKPEKIPSWLVSKSKAEIEAAVTNRWQYMAARYGKDSSPYKVDQFDVNNEAEHGEWYEEKTLDRKFTDRMMNMMSTMAPNVKLFLNDYNVASDSMFTQAYKFHAMEMIQRNVPFYGIGIQSHFVEYPDPHKIKARLDEMAETGKKLWITEFTYETPDETARANAYDIAYNAFFSHPAVEGLVIWGPIKEDNGNHDNAVIQGNPPQENATGKRIRNLIKNVWSTNETVKPGSDYGYTKLQGFYGLYDVTVKYNGQVKTNGTFYFSKGQMGKYFFKL